MVSFHHRAAVIGFAMAASVLNAASMGGDGAARKQPQAHSDTAVDRRFEFGGMLSRRAQLSQVPALSSLQSVQPGSRIASDRFISHSVRPQFLKGDEFLLQLIAQLRHLGMERVGLTAHP